MITRRDFVRTGLAVGGAVLVDVARARAQEAPPTIRPESKSAPTQAEGPYQPVITPNGTVLPYSMRDGVKEYHVVAEPCLREFAPGMQVKCWGYNGQTPGPTIECVEGDHVRLFVTNNLPEHTTIHWHGIFVPSGMDGVGGLNQPHIKPGETYVYEFVLRQHGTFMYHPHADEMVQMAVGMMGSLSFIPRSPANNRSIAISRSCCTTGRFIRVPIALTLPSWSSSTCGLSTAACFQEPIPWSYERGTVSVSALGI